MVRLGGTGCLGLLFCSLTIGASHVRAPDDGTGDRRPALGASRTEPAPHGPSDELDTFTLVGRISPEEVGPYQGSAIMVYRVAESGKLVALLHERVITDRDGRYHASVRLPPGQTPDLVVEATHSGAKGNGMVLVPGWSAVDRVIIAPAIDLKSVLESQIYLDMLSSGTDPASAGGSAIRRMVTPRIAAELHGSRHYREDSAEVRHAMVGAARAWRGALLRPDLGLSEENVALAFDALDWAQVMFDAELYAADTPEERERARSNFAAISGAAYASAGIGPEHLAQAAQASADAMRTYAQHMQGRMRAALISEAEGLRAQYVTGAVESLFIQVGADESQQQAVRSAGARLEGQLLGAIDAGPDIEAYIKRVWTDYRKSVLARLQSIVTTSQDQRLI